MIDNNEKYLPGERNFYDRLSPEEKQEWDSLNWEDRKTWMELEGKVGDEIISELKSIKNKMESNYRRLGEINKRVKEFNKRYNIFGL